MGFKKMPFSMRLLVHVSRSAKFYFISMYKNVNCPCSIVVVFVVADFVEGACKPRYKI